MIQIDDAGSGSFVGGTCIGVYRPETNEYFFEIIPVELYNKENFKNKYYLDEVVAIVSDAFKAMNVHKTETIEICRGYMFEKLRQWLDDKGVLLPLIIRDTIFTKSIKLVNKKL